jgi:hypothetical protein
MLELQTQVFMYVGSMPVLDHRQSNGTHKSIGCDPNKDPTAIISRPSRGGTVLLR